MALNEAMKAGIVIAATVLGGCVGESFLKFIVNVGSGGDAFYVGLVDAGLGLIAVGIGGAVGAVYGLCIRHKRLYGASKLFVALAMAAPAFLWFAFDQGSAAYEAEPTVSDLVARYSAKRAAFDALSNLVTRDSGPGFAINSDVETVSSPRVSAYLNLEHIIGLHLGMRLTDERELDMDFWGQGCAACTDYEKGFAFTRKPPTPLVTDIDKAEEANRERNLTVYQHLEGDWYVYYRQID